MMHIQMMFHQYLEITLMNPVTPNTVSAPTVSPAEAKQILLKDISSKWGKFSELGALKN
jgi:hypothetical protein